MLPFTVNETQKANIIGKKGALLKQLLEARVDIQKLLAAKVQRRPGLRLKKD